MKPEQEALLKAYDAFRDAGEGPEVEALRAIYEAKLEAVAQSTKLPKETIENALRRFHARWVRANLRQGSLKSWASDDPYMRKIVDEVNKRLSGQ